MEYLKPVLVVAGEAATLILGAQVGSFDSGSGSGQTEIPMLSGLDD
jgi:hypothetical protein